MLSRTDKKKRERQLLEAFLKLSGTEAGVEEERESPGFLLSVDQRSVGVEITEIYVPNGAGEFPLKAKESLAAKIVNEARQFYEKAGGIPLHVAVGFSPHTDFQVLNRTATARALAQFLIRQSFATAGVRSWKPTLGGTLPLELSFLNASAVSIQAAAHWYAPQAGWIVPLTVELLRASINEKANKIDDYRKVSPEIWLLLVVAGCSPSQGFDFGHRIDGRAISSPFDRTYLLSLIDSSVQQVGWVSEA